MATKSIVLFECSGPVDGYTQTSTRSELAGGASSILLITSILARMWGIRHRCSFRWLTDSKAAISRFLRYAPRQSRKAKMPDDSDLLALIRGCLTELRRPVIPQRIKGHQDSLKTYNNLPYKVRLNVDADFLATRYQHRGRLFSSKTTDHQDEQSVSILLNGTPITSNYDSTIRYHINGYHLRQYMQEKHG